MSRTRGAARAPSNGLALDERAYITSYTRLGVERVAELVAFLRAQAGDGGKSPASDLLVRAYDTMRTDLM